MGYEPIDAEYETQMEAIYEGVLDQYRSSDSYHEDISRGIEEFTADRQRAFYIENPAVAEPAFNLLVEAQELFGLDRYGAAQVMAGAAAEVALGEALLKPAVYGFIHNDTVAPMFAHIIESTRQVYRFRTLLIETISNLSGINLISPGPESDKGLWDAVEKVRKQRNSILHSGSIREVKKEEAERALAMATTLVETVLPAMLTRLGLHLHDARICAESH